ncbi:MAG: hypothetical protein LH702_18290, partial [Phormidesmis sp. CAN_BIN44]|nr:hypothetical protein [Phormidesmis sp. CAN_BIN44]
LVNPAVLTLTRDPLVANGFPMTTNGLIFSVKTPIDLIQVEEITSPTPKTSCRQHTILRDLLIQFG